MKLPEIVFLVGVSLAVLVLCLHGWLVEGYSPTVILPPAGMAVVIVSLAAWRIWRTLRVGGADSGAALQQAYWQELSGTTRGLLWCMSALPLLLVFGYPFGLTLFAVLYARGHGGGWPGSLLAGGFAFVFCWGMAGHLFGVSMDLLPEWLAGWLA